MREEQRFFGRRR